MNALEPGTDLLIRSIRDDDAAAMIALIQTVFAEYPGCVLAVDDEMPELKTPASAAHAEDGRWWVAEDDDQVVASVAAVPGPSATMELKKLYVAKHARRHGLAAQLVGLVEESARERNAHRIYLWTDTRFEDAHRLYERLGYRRGTQSRALNDLGNTIEFYYTKDLTP
ncbi:MAG TPA: GNAT family N-acetyltransferase [Rhizomicrobium sp.]|jgi:putative acetyltransferase|nr:GNAT family N-acetyltransferase [Rhizomicrobium sp.]